MASSEASGQPGAPLAARLRPTSLADYVGQQHLLAPGRALAGFADVDSQVQLHSMLLWGPPGTGKTTLAGLLATACGAPTISLSAVLAGVKDIREAVAQAPAMRASYGSAPVLFIDEVHRFNKAQQDALLPHVESGTVVLIGATTENPSFEVNSALLSRLRVYVLRPLGPDDLQQLLTRALKLELPGVNLSEPARELLCELADGDARRMLNLLELSAQLAGDGSVDVDDIVEACGDRRRRFDKGGDAFYDQISALHKSVRGSAPDAALYWFQRMLDGGADPTFLARRLTRMASEDVGNADPRALELCIAAWQAYERLGSPEGELALAQSVLYLASVPKSNAVYRAAGAAADFVARTGSEPVPMHLRNAPTQLMKSLGAGEGYRYAHDEAGGYAAGERYFPDEMEPQVFYEPAEQGLEVRIRDRLARLRQLDRDAGGDGR